MTSASALYRGEVVHKRVRPKRHMFRYGVFSLLLDLDELPALAGRLRLFAYNRPGPVAFHDRDHGPTTGSALRPWVEDRMREAGVEPDGGPIRLLCYPRILGYVFNPLSVFFCHRRDGTLAATLYEVSNTFGERHTYAIPVTADGRSIVRQSCIKRMHVSPFIGMEAKYRFRVLPPGEKVHVVIREEDPEGLLLAASFSGRRTVLDDRALAGALVRFPFLTLKIIAGIHWEALRMWLKGFPLFRHRPAAGCIESSVGQVETHRS